MAITVRVPTTLRTLTAGVGQVEVHGDTLQAVLESLESAHPGFQERIIDGEGDLAKYVNVFVDDEDVRFLDGLSTEVPDGITVAIVPAVAGG